MDNNNQPKKNGIDFEKVKQNLYHTFGHGPGRVALIAVVVVLILFLALAWRGMNSQPQVQTKMVDSPTGPIPPVSVEPIDERELQRRRAVAEAEAERARLAKQSYQPDFNPAVTKGGASVDLKFGNQPTLPGATDNAAPQTPVEVAKPADPGVDKVKVDNRQQELERKQAEASARLEKFTYDNFEELMGAKPNIPTGIRAGGSYTTVSYAGKTSVNDLRNTALNASASGPTMAQNATAPAPEIQVLFKAGKVIYATLDAEVNTDDGGEVFATVRGGPWNGSKLIGKIEQGPHNIRLHFSVLAPQDDRPTVAINALAIRESDARQGVAENINNHTIERYTALFAGSILSGLGKAAAQQQSDTLVLQNGQTIVSTKEASDKRIAMYAAGEVGNAAGAEVARGFGRPPTYSTPAGKGVGVIFLQDVVEKVRK